ncbi:hypothetical protein K490DRAFT_55668 [Saccharata proteae CBS 121410]|uniref:Uncharacterized protein n=1 Tax=Saccharata proteae CBS 121410 TaxID=1314787 RepID=A0A6A5YCJ3_9PEZI|nr:hypothetical protein K490DRAFT_55668 [Saccharata proteae CBS 121410]
MVVVVVVFVMVVVVVVVAVGGVVRRREPLRQPASASRGATPTAVLDGLRERRVAQRRPAALLPYSSLPSGQPDERQTLEDTEDSEDSEDAEDGVQRVQRVQHVQPISRKSNRRAREESDYLGRHLSTLHSFPNHHSHQVSATYPTATVTGSHLSPVPSTHTRDDWLDSFDTPARPPARIRRCEGHIS